MYLQLLDEVKTRLQAQEESIKQLQEENRKLETKVFIMKGNLHMMKTQNEMLLGMRNLKMEFKAEARQKKQARARELAKLESNLKGTLLPYLSQSQDTSSSSKSERSIRWERRARMKIDLSIDSHDDDDVSEILAYTVIDETPQQEKFDEITHISSSLLSAPKSNWVL